MKLSKKISQIPLFAFAIILVISAMVYFTVSNFGFNFGANLVQTTRAEIQGQPDDINPVVSEIYTNVDIISTEIGDDNAGVQIQRLSFESNEDTKNKIKEIIGNNEKLKLSFAEVTPGIKTDFSRQLINLLLLVGVSFVIINITLFRKVFDYNQTFLYTLLNILSILIGVAILLTVFSLMGNYGWHVSNYTLNMFVTLVFSAAAGLVGISLLFKHSLNQVEYVGEIGDSYVKFINSGIKPHLLISLIILIAIAPLLFFYQFRIEALIGILSCFSGLILLKYAYLPVLSWYDEVRRIKNKISKKKK
jgi:hypothetical protein